MGFSWSVHPIKKDIRKTTFLFVFIVLIALLVYFSFNNLYFSVLAVLLLVVSVRQFFVRTHYTLNAEGVEVRSLGTSRKRPWNYFRSFYVDNNGVLLSPFEGKSRLENFRGVYLLLPEKNRQEILDFIKQTIGLPPPSQEHSK